MRSMHAPRGRHVATALLCGLALLLAFAPAGAADEATAAESPRAGAIAALDALVAAAAKPVAVEVDGLQRGSLQLGDPVAFRFRPGAEGYLSVLYVDHNGIGTLLYPASNPEAARVAAGQTISVPSAGSGLELVVSLPLGDETVFAMTSREPLPLATLGLEGAGDTVVMEADDTARLAGHLRDWVATLPPGSVSAGREEHHIEPGATRGVPQYTSDQIVSYFQTTRSIKRPELDLNIKFPFGSAQLTEQARRDLDEVGRALNDPSLVAGRFELAGHTDDVGSPDYNALLSQQRADAVREYLEGSHGLASGRVGAKGYGESEPEVAGQDELARARNRRVVLRRLR